MAFAKIIVIRAACFFLSSCTEQHCKSFRLLMLRLKLYCFFSKKCFFGPKKNSRISPQQRLYHECNGRCAGWWHRFYTFEILYTAHESQSAVKSGSFYLYFNTFFISLNLILSVFSHLKFFHTHTKFPNFRFGSSKCSYFIHCFDAFRFCVCVGLNICCKVPEKAYNSLFVDCRFCYCCLVPHRQLLS